MTSDLQALRSAGVLSALDVQLARALARLGQERDERVLVAVALASRQAQAGHVCLDLRSWLQAPLVADEHALSWPALDEWLAALRASDLVADDEAHARPLYLDARDRLYLRRLYDQERAVAKSVTALAELAALEVDEAVLQAGLERLFPAGSPRDPLPAAEPKKRARAGKDPAQMSLWLEPTVAPVPLEEASEAQGPDLQRLAAERAVRSRFTVITGGPGTGKTHTVVNVLALLIEQAFAQRREAPRVLLLAPTGKAVARLAESVRKAKGELRCDERVRAEIRDEASTLHRALGVRRDTDRRGRGAELEPLVADVVIVDEASMVDLALMTRLLQVVPKSARLVLLGDKDQLASVEAGAVLGDICGAGLPRASESQPMRPLARAIVELTKTRRFKADSGIRALAEAIRIGDVDAALAVLRDPNRQDVVLREHAAAAGSHVRSYAPAIDAELFSSSVRAFTPLFRERAIEARLAQLETFRVLCAHRNGPYGVVELNRRIEQALHEAGVLRSIAGGRYDGRPILVTENDYDSKLFNGDVGVLHEDQQEQLRACFPKVGGSGETFSPISLARLPAHESVYAMSVHKSQGSEADEVAIVLPEAESPLLSRELLYTAVTRARNKVVVYASLSAIEACVSRPIRRASGLRDALWSPV